MSTGSLSIGGNGGAFAFTVTAPINTWSVKGGKFLDWIQIKDKSAGGSGGDGNPQSLKLSDEDYITEISGCYGSYVNQITIITSSGATISAGKNDPKLQKFDLQAKGKEKLVITQVSCNAGKFIDRLVIDYEIR